MDKTKDINQYLGRILVSREEIQKMVKELGARITEDYRGKNLVLIGVLKGGFVFMADLAREIGIPFEMDFIAVSSYGSSTKTSGVVRLIKDIDIPLNDEGHKQAKQIAEIFKDIDIEIIISSPLSRALDTAKYIVLLS